jgi:hypothetical protein
MAGKRTGFKRRVLPKRLMAGQLDRLNRNIPEVRAVILGAQQIIEDRGGESQASLLLQRAAYRCMHLDVLLSRDELTLAEGKAIDRVAYINAATTWLRYADKIGLSRAPRPVKTLAEILAEPEEESPPPEQPAARALTGEVQPAARADEGS